MSSIREVAKEAEVSIATVSRVLNGHSSVNPELRAKVLRAANACEYQRTVGKRTADRVAVIYTGPFFVGSPYDSACLEGAVNAMRRSPYDLDIVDLHRDRQEGESLRQFFSRKGICGAIVRSIMEHRHMLDEFADEGLPVVVLGDHFDHPKLNFCFADSKPASRDAVEHLVSLGHKDIGFVSCDRDDGDHYDRLTAYREVLESAGLYREDFVYRVPPHRLDGGPLIRRILSKRERPTALFVADPMVAVGILNESHMHGVRVPGDLSIVTIDDLDTRNMVYPKLSAVCQDSRRIGEMAFEIVCRMINGEDVRSLTDWPQEAWFELNDSTAPPPETVDRFLPGDRMASPR